MAGEHTSLAPLINLSSLYTGHRAWLSMTQSTFFENSLCNNFTKITVMAISTLSARIKYAHIISKALQHYHVEIVLMLPKDSTCMIIIPQKYSFLLLIRPSFCMLRCYETQLRKTQLSIKCCLHQYIAPVSCL